MWKPIILLKKFKNNSYKGILSLEFNTLIEAKNHISNCSAPCEYFIIDTEKAQIIEHHINS